MVGRPEGFFGDRKSQLGTVCVVPVSSPSAQHIPEDHNRNLQKTSFRRNLRTAVIFKDRTGVLNAFAEFDLVKMSACVRRGFYLAPPPSSGFPTLASGSNRPAKALLAVVMLDMSDPQRFTLRFCDLNMHHFLIFPLPLSPHSLAVYFFMTRILTPLLV